MFWDQLVCVDVTKMKLILQVIDLRKIVELGWGWVVMVLRVKINACKFCWEWVPISRWSKLGRSWNSISWPSITTCPDCSLRVNYVDCKLILLLSVFFIVHEKYESATKKASNLWDWVALWLLLVDRGESAKSHWPIWQCIETDSVAS